MQMAWARSGAEMHAFLRMQKGDKGRGPCACARAGARGNNTVRLPHIVEDSSARKGVACSRRLIRENEVDPGVDVRGGR